MRTWAWIALFVLAALLITWVATSNSFEDCISHYKNQEGASQFEKSLAFLFGVRTCIGAYVISNKEAIGAIAALLVAFFTIVLVGFTDVLARVSRQQIADSRILQRAYLSAEPRGIHIMNDKTIIAHLAFINVGGLPARNVRNEVKIGWFEDGHKSNFESIKVSDPSTILLLPKVAVERGTDNLSEDDAAQYRAGRGFVYVWGRVEYEDGFRRPRWLIFCHRYNCSKPEALRQHHHHNNGN